ncbi:MAG: hypothetical protein QW480_01865 [Candidatus Aenigmatarchaeota archaeon]
MKNLAEMKNNKNINIKDFLESLLLIFSIILILSTNAFALTGSIRPARMILYPNITNNTINLINGSIFVSNVNDIPVNVSISTSGNIDTDATFFTLYPNQEREVKFNIFIWMPGNYSMSIGATFSAENEISVGVGSEIIVYANGSSVANNNKAPSKPSLISPANKTFINASETTITLEWSSASDEDSSILAYYYEVDDSQDFSSPLTYGWTLKREKSITLRDGAWYWRVKVTDGKYENVSDTWVIFIGSYNVTTTTTSTSTTSTTTTIPTTTTTTIQQNNTTQGNNTMTSTTTTTLQTTSTTTSTSTTTILSSYGGGSGGSSAGSSSQSFTSTTTILTTISNNTQSNSSFENVTEEPLIGSIRPPRMVLRCEAPCNLSGWIEVSNVNNYSIKVKTQLIGDFYDKIKLSEREFELGVDEKKIVNFTIPISVGGNYESTIVFIFSPLEKSEPNLALASDIIIIANQSTNFTTTTIKEGNAPSGMIVAIARYGAIALVVIVAIAIFIIWNRRKEPLGKKMIKKWMKKNAIFLIFFLSLIFFANISFAYGNANLAVVVKNASRISDYHEKPIIERLNALGYHITLVDSLIDFSNFDAIVILARECLSNDNLGAFAANIPVNNYPTLVVGCGYLYDWGWVSSGGIGKVASSGIHSITITNFSHPITQGYNGTISVHFSSGYPITFIDRYKTNLKSLATYSTSSSTIIIAYAEANTTLSNGNKNKERIVFFGVNYPLYWTDAAKEMFIRALEWVIDDSDRDGVKDRMDNCLNTTLGEVVDSQGCACYQKSCDDNIECTIDYCNVENAECIHELNHSYCLPLNGIYNLSEWIDADQCKKIEIVVKERREYRCSLNGCIYEVLERETIETSNIINKEDGTTCDDSLWCTVNDSCQAGVCKGIRVEGECSCNEDCVSRCEGDIFIKGICNNCSCIYENISCSSFDDWYETNETRWVDIDYKTQRKEIKKEYRTHYCSLEGCKYNVTNESWIDGNETRIRENGLVLYEGIKLFVNGNERTLIINIDNSSNLSRKFENVKDIVLKDSNNNPLVKFYFNFSTRNLNLSNVVIKKNENSSRGSLVIYGLNSSLLLNQTKTIWVDRKLNANHVCIKDAEISSISEINRNCNSSNEFLIKCDGSIYNASNGARYSCIIQNNYYIISGLMHSGVIEIETCNDGIRNQGEEGIDCGGPCAPCQTTTTSTIVTTTSSSSFKRLECYAPSSIVLDEGDTKIIEINVRNVGNIALYNVRASLSGISKDWYNITSQTSKIESQANTTFILNLKGVKSGNYNITFDAFDTSSLLCSKKISLKVNEKITTTIYTPEYPKNQSEIEETTTIEEENISEIIGTSSVMETPISKEEKGTLITGMITLFRSDKILLTIFIISIIFISVTGFYTFDHLKTKKTIENAYKKYEEWKKKNGDNFNNNGLSNKKVEFRRSYSKRPMR